MITCGYIFANLISGSVTITPSTEDAVYTKASLYDKRINKPFRFTAKSGQTLTFDFFAAKTVDLLVILKHNFTSTVSLTLKWSADGSFTDGGLATVAWAATNIYKRLTPSQSYRYWRLELDDATNPRNPEMGEMYIGVAVEFARAYAWGSEEGRVYSIDQHTTEFGTKIVYPKYNVRTRRLAFSPMSESAKDAIATLYNTVSGSLFPFVLFPDLATTDCIFGRLMNAYGSVTSPEPYYSSALEFVSESPGKAVT